MIKLKTMGLAFVAVLMVGAVGAASASAENNQFTVQSGIYPQSIVTEDVGAADAFTTSIGELTCDDETFSGELASASDELTVTPEYRDCHTGNGNPVTVTHNGCEFTFSVTETVETDVDRGQVKIVCPSNKVIEAHHYTNASNHASGQSSCTETIGSQTANGKITYTSDTVSNDVEVHGTPQVGIQAHGLCTFGFTINSTATYDASVTVSVPDQRVHVG